MPDIEYRLDIDKLDGAEASFTGSHGVTLSLPRAEWEIHGRPAQVYIVPRMGPSELPR